MNKGKPILIVVVIAAVAVIGGVFGIRYFMRIQAVAPFNAKVGEYLSPTKPSSGAASVKGKVVAIDREKKEVDWDVHFGLPDDLQAKNPDEVGTIVVIKWNEISIGEYEGGQPAIQMSAEVTVINKETMEIMGQPATFQGKAPPDKIKKNSGQNKGPKPTDKVLDFVKGLPKK